MPSPMWSEKPSQYHGIWPNFQPWGSCTHPFTNPGHIWPAGVNSWCMISHQISCQLVYIFTHGRIWHAIRQAVGDCYCVVCEQSVRSADDRDISVTQSLASVFVHHSQRDMLVNDARPMPGVVIHWLAARSVVFWCLDVMHSVTFSEFFLHHDSLLWLPCGIGQTIIFSSCCLFFFFFFLFLA